MIERNVDIESLFEPGSEDVLEVYLRLLHPADIADLFDYVDEQYWSIITKHLTAERLAELLANLDDGQVEKLSQKIKIERLVAAVEELETDDATDVLQDLPDAKVEAILESLEEDERDELETLLSYPEDSAGGLMQTEVCRVDQGSLVGDAIEAVRRIREDVTDILEVYVVDSELLVGTVALEDLVLTKPNVSLSEISSPIQHSVTPERDQEEVAQLFSKYNLPTLAVVDTAGILLGRITFDDIQDVIEAEATEDVMKMAGASNEEFVYGSDFFRIAIFRMPWLVTSLVGSLLATILVPMFTTISADAIVLASFVPVVAAMTGNLGSQTAMIITRGFATGKVDLATIPRTLLRELTVGVIMGLSAGVLVALFALIKNGNSLLGLALGLSMVSSMTMASLAGVVTPCAFKKIGIDPAIAAGPLVTTACDVLGIGTYLVVAIIIVG